MNNSENVYKANIQIIINKIQELYINIKVIDIDYFHEHVISITTALTGHSMILT